MGQPAQSQAKLDDFPGIVRVTGALDVPAGASLEQINIQSSWPGQLIVRPGYLLVTFENSTSEAS